jgi:glycosyltransferase involved in cell wall biosynthesis
MSGGFEVSVVIPTHNRSDLLGSSIRSALEQQLPLERYEVIVVDNASTDATRRIVERFQQDPRVRYVHEPRLGLSHARNTGWRAANGPIVAFLDDDAVAGSDWLQGILSAFERGPTRPGCVGGPVEGIWEAPRPGWLGDPLLTGLTIIDWGPEAHIIEDLRQEWLVGANFAFPVEVLQDLGGFTPGLDRSGTRLLSSGDVHMTAKIQEAGLDCWYDPRVKIRHHVPRARLSKRWFVRRYYGQGLSDAAMALIDSGSSLPTRLKGAGSVAKELLKSPRALTTLVLPTEDPDRFTERCFTLIKVGHLFGLLTMPGS